MKKLIIFSLLFITAIAQSQIVNLPDSNFKNRLLVASTVEHVAKDINNNWIVIDTNNDGEIQETEALNVYQLHIDYLSIANLTGIASFTNLTYLDCSYNALTSLDLSVNVNLKSIYASSNSLTSLNINFIDGLLYLSCENNNLTTLNLASSVLLTYLNCSYNMLNSLDVSNCIELSELFCGSNSISTLNLVVPVGLTKLDCKDNNLTNLDLQFSPVLTNLSCDNNNIGSLNLNTSSLLTNLSCKNTGLSVLDVSILPNLISLNCENNSLTNLDLTNSTALLYLFCSSNNLANLNVGNNLNLINLQCSNNTFEILDLSSNGNLTQLKCGYNPNLLILNLKNGNNEFFNLGSFSDFESLPSLYSVCVDELNNTLANFIDTESGGIAIFTQYCSLIPANTNEIKGMVKFDSNLDGCDQADFSMTNKMVTTSNGTDTFSTFTQSNSNYSIFTPNGYFDTTLSIEIPSYVTVSPNSQTNNFVGFGNIFTADFCVVPNNYAHDVNAIIIPVIEARPGFVARYSIVFNNNGVYQENGTITLSFDTTKLSFIQSSPNESNILGNIITFDYSNLNPFETRVINLDFNVLAPPVANINETISFVVDIPLAGDVKPDDNSFILNQVLVGSYDPNDIHILEGTQISFNQKEERLNYVIRFQNTGTADAINVVVKNVLDDTLDWSSLSLKSMSHQGRVAIKNGKEIEFIFENIHLPGEQQDEANSHGYIAYSIKAKNTIVVDEVIPNKADIFFDFNEAIETNIAVTKYVNVLGVDNKNIYNFSIYPSPTNDVLFIKTKDVISNIKVYSSLGNLVLSKSNVNKINVSNLETGLYLVKITNNLGQVGINKMIKK